MRCTTRLKQGSSLILITLATVTFAVQNKPDFSGRWILATPPQSGPDIPLALSVRQTVVRTTIHGDAMEPFFKDITVDRQFEGGTQSETRQIGVLGGVVPGLRRDGGPSVQTTHHEVKWEGDSLVFEDASYTAQHRESGLWAERRENWSLDPRAPARGDHHAQLCW